jgi:hypothetical protein
MFAAKEGMEEEDNSLVDREKGVISVYPALAGELRLSAGFAGRPQ